MFARFLTFLAGMLACLLLLVATAWLGAKHVAAWTVVSAEPVKADAIVVLGGGDGSRLRAGLRLYEQGFASRLILVDSRKEDWLHITRSLCKECVLDGKDVTILEGSTSTQTDAELTLTHCQRSGLKSVLVVTSPYHTRRARMVFNDTYGPIGIRMQVINTDDFGKLKIPTDTWWQDDSTMQAVWVEFGKILYWKMLGAR